MKLKKGDIFRYVTQDFDFKAKLMNDPQREEYGIYGEIISFRKKGWIDDMQRGKLVSFSRNGLKKFATKIDMEFQEEPTSIYLNKNAETITQTIRKTK